MKKIFLISFYLVFISFFVIAASVSTDKKVAADAIVKWDTTGASGISFGFYSDTSNTTPAENGYTISTTTDLTNKSITGTGSGYIGWNIISSKPVVIEISATPFVSTSESTPEPDKIPLLVSWSGVTGIDGAEGETGTVGSETEIPGSETEIPDAYEAVPIFKHTGNVLGTSGNFMINFVSGNAYGKKPDSNYEATVTISVKDDSAGGQ